MCANSRESVIQTGLVLIIVIMMILVITIVMTIMVIIVMMMIMRTEDRDLGVVEKSCLVTDCGRVPDWFAATSE